MTELEIKNESLAGLNRIVEQMMSAAFLGHLRGATATERKKAGQILMMAQHARLSLRTAKLAEIRDQLAENEKELAQGRKALGKALDELNDVANVLATVAAFLKTVGKVVSLVL